MADKIALNFSLVDDPKAYTLYKGLQKAGIEPEEVDAGYRVTNYAGLHCKGDVDHCVKGAGDGSIEAMEVYEYAFENYRDYQKLIEATFDRPLPWVLDDLDPKTKFDDEEIRPRVQDAIDTLEKILKKKKVKEGTEKHDELMALGLFWFASTPDIADVADNSDYFEGLTESLVKSGLGKFQDYLRENGGLYVGDPEEQFVSNTAIDALELDEGNCLERSHILYGVFSMAGLDPDFVIARVSEKDVGHKGVPELLRDKFDGLAAEMGAKIPGLNHIYVELEIGGKRRLFDPALTMTDVEYSTTYTLSSRQYFSYFFNQLGNDQLKKNNMPEAEALYMQSLEIDPLCASSLMGLGGVYTSSLLDKKIESSLSPLGAPKVEELYKKALKYYDASISIDPNVSPAFFGRGLLNLYVGKFSQAEEDFTECLKLEPKNYSDILKHLRIKYDALWGPDAEISGAIKDDTNSSPGRIISFFMLAKLLWNVGNREAARKELAVLADCLEFVDKPSKTTTEFFRGIIERVPGDIAADKKIAKQLKILKGKVGMK
jgi:tetratricopeptide (TPR) repeat protein